MDLEQLRHFVRLAEVGNFTRAAELIGMSQSALSRSIARLEEEIGQPLLDRQSRLVCVNDAGRLFLERARQMLAMMDDVQAEIRDDGESGKVRVGAIPTIAPYFLPVCLRTFHKQYPQAQVIVIEDTTESLLKKVASGEVDIAIAALPIQVKYVEVCPLFSEELLLVTSRDHPLAEKAQVRTVDLVDEPFVLLGEAHCLSENIITFCQQKSFLPVSVEQTTQLAMVQELVALGHGISLVPAMARLRDTSRQRVYRSLAGEKPTRTIVQVTNPYRYHRQIVLRFQELVKKIPWPEER